MRLSRLSAYILGVATSAGGYGVTRLSPDYAADNPYRFFGTIIFLYLVAFGIWVWPKWRAHKKGLTTNQFSENVDSNEKQIRLEAVKTVIDLRDSESGGSPDRIRKPLTELRKQAEAIGVYGPNPQFVGDFETYSLHRLMFQHYQVQGGPPAEWQNRMRIYCRLREHLAARHLIRCLRGQSAQSKRYMRAVQKMKDNFSDERQWSFTQSRLASSGEWFIDVKPPGAPGTIEKDF